MNRFDRWFAHASRHVARHTSRRSFLTLLGASLAGVSGFPVLPVARAAEQRGSAAADPVQDPNHCEYWRNCGMDGFLCGCCGGSSTSCPPGTEMAKTTWIGTCRDPSDGRDYIIAYNDCCGMSTCNRCMCGRHEGDRPIYYPAKSNNVNWCASASTNVYHCTTTLLLGLSEPEPP
ncbi:MAG: methylamine dehydrogenase (amicyanin) light chain [Gammaproteobacteria bacterium]|nr:methylamine dehydrogenase (amicyanin) light chain [Gammaproteobacteria bacterium]